MRHDTGGCGYPSIRRSTQACRPLRPPSTTPRVPAADAMRWRIHWTDLLGLNLTDPGFDAAVLSEFRSLLIDADGLVASPCGPGAELIGPVPNGDQWRARSSAKAIDQVGGFPTRSNRQGRHLKTHHQWRDCRAISRSSSSTAPLRVGDLMARNRVETSSHCMTVGRSGLAEPISALKK